MSSELSLFEAMGGTYRTQDDIFYPNISSGSEEGLSAPITDIGKYGLIWISYMKENHTDRYRHHIRMGQLHCKAQEVNEEAYEMLDRIMNQFLAFHKPKDSNSTMEMWRLREQAKQLAEEVIYGQIVYQYH
ncbi:MAG: TnpV protein [Lachnospiraceae bacterium]|nr:TnpV protein [Lachnospiraceae bacterium]